MVTVVLNSTSSPSSERMATISLALSLNSSVYAGKQLLQVGLDDHRVGGLAQYLQQVIVADKVESWEDGPLFLQWEWYNHKWP